MGVTAVFFQEKLPPAPPFVARPRDTFPARGKDSELAAHSYAPLNNRSYLLCDHAGISKHIGIFEAQNAIASPFNPSLSLAITFSHIWRIVRAAV